MFQVESFLLNVSQDEPATSKNKPQRGREHAFHEAITLTENVEKIFIK